MSDARKIADSLGLQLADEVVRIFLAQSRGSLRPLVDRFREIEAAAREGGAVGLWESKNARGSGFSRLRRSHQIRMRCRMMWAWTMQARDLAPTRQSEIL